MSVLQNDSLTDQAIKVKSSLVEEEVETSFIRKLKVRTNQVLFKKTAFY